MFGNESSPLISVVGTKVPRNESSTYGTFVPGNESSLVRKFQLPHFWLRSNLKIATTCLQYRRPRGAALEASPWHWQCCQTLLYNGAIESALRSRPCTRMVNIRTVQEA